MSRPHDTWWGRNWKWFVPVGCGTLVLVFAAFLVGVVFFATSMMSSTDAYKLAVNNAKASPEVRAALGEPIEPGRMASGSFEENGASGKADLQIPLRGPKGHGTLYVAAEKHVGEWKFNDLVFEDAGGRRIDLLASDTPPPTQE